MYKTTLKNGNIIYHSVPFEQIRHKIHFHNASHCSVFLAPKAKLQSGSIHLHSDHAAVFIGDSRLGKAQIFVYEQSCVYIGNKVYINENIEQQAIRCAPRTNVVMGDHGALSAPIEIMTTDVHLIYDKATRRRINEEQSIFIGDHVWMGREVKVYKGACISSGCMCAARSIVTRGIKPSNSLITGLPGQLKKKGEIFWLSPSSYYFTEADRERYALLDETDALYLKACYSPNKEEMIHPADLDITLKSLKSSQDKIAFLYDKLYLNAAQNRFVWDDQTCESDGKVLDYNDTFAKLSFEREKSGQSAGGDTSLPELTTHDIFLLLQAKKLRRLFVYYAILSIIGFGRKRRYYKDRKREIKKLLQKVNLLHDTAI